LQAFTIDPESPISVKQQLKAQITYQVLAGILRPGEQLPSLRDLAAGLGINLNTVVRALAEVEAEGYVVSQQGRGIFVREEPPAPGVAGALRALVAQAVGRSQEWGLQPLDLALAVLAHSRMVRPPGAPQQRLLLLGGHRPALRRLRALLESTLAVPVDAGLIDDLTDLVRSHDYRAVIATPFYHREAVRHLPAALATAPDPWAPLLAAEEGTRVCVAAPDWVLAARARRAMEAAGLGHLAIELRRVSRPEEALACEAPFVVAVGDAAGAFGRGAAAKPGVRGLGRAGPVRVRVLTETEEIAAEAILRLQRLIGERPAVKRMVSPWV
jgi:DNA-binding transcriptional regulator YhcF (GntR family)